MPYLQAGDVQTYYQKIGHGPTLVLLHGWGQRWDCWAPIIPLLSDQFSLILPDLPAFGQSSVPNQAYWNTEAYARWLKHFLEGLQLQAIGLIGHSYGGKILLEYASGNRDSKKIALLAPSGIRLPKSAKHRAISTLVGVIPASLKRLVPSNLKKKFYTSVVKETDYVLATPFQKETLRHILEEDYTARATQLPSGTLLIGGLLDEAVPPEALHILARQIPKASLHLLQTGHFPFQEKPQQCGQLLKDFFS